MAKANRPEKTNAMRILENLHIPFDILSYESDGEAKDAVTVARLVGAPKETVYKTLITIDPQNRHFVLVVPGHFQVDLKKAAAAFSVKSLAMEKVSDLKPLTGYVRGGCSPIGMKKPFPTLVDERAKDLDALLVSGGRIGVQIRLKPGDLLKAADARFADLCGEAIE